MQTKEPEGFSEQKKKRKKKSEEGGPPQRPRKGMDQTNTIIDFFGKGRLLVEGEGSAAAGEGSSAAHKRGSPASGKGATASDGAHSRQGQYIWLVWGGGGLL